MLLSQAKKARDEELIDTEVTTRSRRRQDTAQQRDEHLSPVPLTGYVRVREVEVDTHGERHETAGATEEAEHERERDDGLTEPHLRGEQAKMCQNHVFGESPIERVRELG